MTNPNRLISRRGKTMVVAMVALAILGLIVLFVVLPMFGSGTSSSGDDPSTLLTHTVQRGLFESYVTESGDIESSGNFEIKCKVKSEGGAGTRIIWIIDEGTSVSGPQEIQANGDETVESLVEKFQVAEEDLLAANDRLEETIEAKGKVNIPGELLVQFNDSLLQTKLTQQEILVANDERLVIDAESELKKAEQTLNEYKKGLFIVDKVTFESELLQAQSELKTSQDYLGHSQRMFKKGYVSRLQLEAQEVAVKMAEKKVEVVETKLMVHNEFTLDKKVNEFEAEIRKQQAALKAAQSTLKLSQQRKREIEEQIAECRVHAPRKGQVVFANDFERRENIVIEKGAQIREDQAVIRLPNPKMMKVRVRINDSKIKQIKNGNRVKIELDVNPNLHVEGVVAKINPFPFPRQWYGGPIEYGTEVTIENPPDELTPGQRAKVRIFVERSDDVIQVPIQSVVERSGNHYCIVQTGDGSWSTRKVLIGSSNGSFVVLNDGIKEDERVALNPDLIWEDVAKEQATDAEPTGVANKTDD